MIKTHILEDGDIIKILPMIDKDDNISWIKTYDCVGLNKSFIYDNSDKGYLNRINKKLRQSDSGVKLPIVTRHAMNVYIDGEIRILNVTRTLYQMIINNPKLWDIGGNHQLFIVKTEVSVGGGQLFPSYDKSYVSEKSWTPPVNDINSQDEWISWIKLNQPDFDNHLQKNSIFANKQRLTNYLGKDMLSELISDDRELKLEKLGI